jgi:hypothetical protein
MGTLLRFRRLIPSDWPFDGLAGFIRIRKSVARVPRSSLNVSRRRSKRSFWRAQNHHLRRRDLVRLERFSFDVCLIFCGADSLSSDRSFSLEKANGLMVRDPDLPPS